MTQQPTTKPFETIRDGNIKATIWVSHPKDAEDKGPFYRVQITRTWRDEQGKYHDSDSFSGTELLRVARLAHIAYDEIARFRIDARTSRQDGAFL